MPDKIKILLYSIFILLVSVFFSSKRTEIQIKETQNIELANGQWFNGKSFEIRKFYSVNGRFASHRPSRIDTIIDLTGTFILPPLGEAHNHNIGSGVEDWDKKAIQKYLKDGIFYVKIQGNLPLKDEEKTRLGINRPTSIDVSFAQGSLTASGAHPIPLIERVLLPQGYFPGYNKETLKDFRYFIIDSEAELERKWPQILSLKPDFIKFFLGNSSEFEKLKRDTTARYKGLDPSLIPKIVEKAHRQKLKVSVHVVNAADFHNAVMAGVDEIAHLPRFMRGVPHESISKEDAKQAAKRGIVVITTVAVSLRQERLNEAEFPFAQKSQATDLKILLDNDVPIAIGSDDPSDNSIKELFYLKDLGVFNNLTLLKMWTETTAKTIFPDRRIGALKEGYEASFIALEGNPIEDLNNVQKIKFRFKQGILLEQ